MALDGNEIKVLADELEARGWLEIAKGSAAFAIKNRVVGLEERAS